MRTRRQWSLEIGKSEDAMTDGTIRAREAHQVIADLMAENKVPRGVWSLSPRGKLSILVGSRQVNFDCPAGMSFYGLKSLCAKIEVALRERDIAQRHRGQIDLEEVIARAQP